MRVGLGVDVHAFGPNRKLILGGVTIPYHLGLVGHSDADVLTHAIMDALLGACGQGSIGEHFPDTDAAYKNADSIELLKEVLTILKKNQLKVLQIDTVIVAQAPKLSAFRALIQENLAKHLNIPASQVGFKATTSEHLGFTGRKEGILAHAIVLCQPL